MSRTLTEARTSFITAMNRDTAGSDRARYIEVLDALIAWSVARPDQLQFREEETNGGVVSFCRAGTKVVFWAARSMRHDGPKLELLPHGAGLLSEERRTAARETINGCSRNLLEPEDRLSIGFGAMKNPNVRNTVFTLMSELLTEPAPVTTSP